MIGTLNTIAEAWWGWMGPMFWQVSLLILIVGVIDLLIRRWAWPQVRHALWLLVLIKLVIPPTWTYQGAIIPKITEPVQQAVSERWTSEGTPRASDRRSMIENVDATDPTVGMDTSPGHIANEDTGAIGGKTEHLPVSWKSYALLAWILGMVAFATLLLSRTARLRRWHREQEEKRTIPPWFLELMVATAKRLKLERLPAIVFSDETTSPAVYGFFHPVLLLPAHSAKLPPDEAEHVLLHELAHLKRGDLWLHGFSLLLQMVYWFNPLLIWAFKQIKHVRELCCDLTVANLLKEKTLSYRQTLLDTARRLLTENTEPALALLGVFEEPFRLVSRLRWLEKETWKKRTPAFVTAFFVLVIGAPLLLPMATGEDMGALDATLLLASNPPIAHEEQTGSENSSHRSSAPVVYIRNEFVGHELVLGFSVRSELFAVSETWVGDGIIAGTERGKTVIVDRRKQKLTYIDHKHKFWTETPLPLDLEQAMCEHSLETRAGRRSSGEVTPTRHSRRLLGRKCREFHIHSWYVGSGRIHTEEWIKVWASTDVPFDLSLYDELLYNLRLIYNRDAVYRSELEKIEGLQMGIELRDGNFLKGRKYEDRVVVLEQRTPPPDTFSPPLGYERRERIEELEF
jgi:beta-lactamase regulating signal transducer with metallopeptidase domain